MLTFLNPWFWLGALAVGAPIWLHLRRKEPKNLVQFSALRFLEDEPQAKQSPLRVQQILLLLLRIMALLLLIAALAWPFRQDDLPPVVRESHVYLIDNTMSRQVGNGFASDLEKVRERIADTPSDIQVAVVELTGQSRVIVSFADDRATVKEKLALRQPSHQRGNYLSAFRLAGNLLNNAIGERKRLFFLGDNQANQWLENVAAPPFLGDVAVELLNQSNRTNAVTLSLSEPDVQRVFLGDKSLVNFSVTLRYPAAAVTAQVAIRANEQIVSDGQVELDSKTGVTILQAQWEADPADWIRGEVVVTNTLDELAADDRVYFSLEPVREGRVAVLAQSGFLRAALSPDVMRGQWAARHINPAELDAEFDRGTDDEALVIESQYLQSAAARKLLWRYLSNGRGALLLLDKVNPAVRGVLKELGFTMKSPQLSFKEQKPAYIFTRHPVFHPFSSPDYGNMTEITFHKNYRVDSSHALPLLFGAEGDGLFFQGRQTPGPLFLATFGLDRRHTSWPIHATFIPFLDLVLQHARFKDQTPTTFQPGELAIIQFPGGSGVTRVILRRDETELASALVVNGRAQLVMPDQPGLYSLCHNDSLEPQKLFAVNPSPLESDLEYLAEPMALQNWKLPDTVNDPTTAEATGGLTVASIWRQQYWWWLLFAGLAMLLGETLWTEFGRRRSQAL